MTDWRAVFGHPDPYPEQVDGVETAVDTARDGGFTVLEGACGTGKTMLALSAGISLVRDPESSFERVVVLTSVKQQLRQFEADLDKINDNLPEAAAPVSGMTLVGKADVCPYSREGAGNIDEASVYERCEGLRDRTRALVEEGTEAGTLAGEARRQQIGLDDAGAPDGPGGATYLETAGEPAPYDRAMPSYDDAEYCPFYAQYLADLPEDGEPADAVPFDIEGEGHIDPERLVELSVAAGTCPHSMMGAVLGEVEVVVANYYHAFDPQTVATFTGALLDRGTFVVCDEAHMLEPRVRDLVSDGVADRTLRDATRELGRVLEPYRGGETRAGTEMDLGALQAEVQESELTPTDIASVQSFLRELRQELDRRITAHLDSTEEGWRADPAALDDAELPLRDPEDPQPDALTEWAREAGHGDAWDRAESVGAVVARALDAAEDDDRERAALSAGRTLGGWRRADHESYFREIVLERTWDESQPRDSWRRAYNARLALQNCVPGTVIGERLGEFGGGILMSATLEPLDVFTEVTGLAALAQEERPVVTRRYGLSFPEANRASFAVDAPKFTHENRGPPGSETETRRAHADAAASVARSPGNVLVGMPSYAEADWLAGVLEERLEKPVLLDEASDDETTESLKQSFFDGPPKVLVTSLRGTLTEGVDYRGDRLAAAAVCGVPIVNTASPRTRAVRTAYDRAFGDGFERALVIPAVRKARQALGRVIRGPEEVGVRVLVDARYARDSWDSVRQYVPEEYRPVSPDMLDLGLERFWRDHDLS
ncbi:MAG: ATP-dependent DNA helicase [Halobacteriaceae archaeon]